MTFYTTPPTCQGSPTTATRQSGILPAAMALSPAEIGARIKEAREAKHWTHEQLAREIGVGLRTVQRWQEGTSLPPVSTLMELADLLEVPQAYFIETEEERLTLEVLAMRFAELEHVQARSLQAADENREHLDALVERLDRLLRLLAELQEQLPAPRVQQDDQHQSGSTP